MYLAFFVALLNVSVMYLAVPRVGATFNADLSEQQWFIGIYPLLQGAFMLAAGTLGDAWGRRRVLTIATALFAVASLASAFAPTMLFLLVARAVEGLSSAALIALPPAMLIALLPSGSQDGPTIKRIGMWGGIAGGLAPAIGGAVVSQFSWPGVFWMSALLAFGVLALLLADTRRDTPGKAGRFDLIGQGIAVLAFVLLSYALIDGDKAGWLSPPILAAFVVGAAALWGLVAFETRSAHPMMHVEYFRRRRFDVSLAMLAVVNFSWYGLFLLCSIFLQEIRRDGALLSGIFLLPCNATFFGANLASVWFARTFGMVQAAAISFVVTLAGIAWLAAMTEQTHGWQIACALGVAGVGWGLIVTPATALGMESVPLRDEGFASATQALIRSISGVFGIALLGSIAGNAVENGAFMRGWPVAMIVAGFVTAAFAVLVLLVLRGRDAKLPAVDRRPA